MGESTLLRTNGAAHSPASHDAPTPQQSPHQANLRGWCAMTVAGDLPFEPLLFARAKQLGVLLPRVIDIYELVHDRAPLGLDR
jgi:hypothetical protein